MLLHVNVNVLSCQRVELPSRQLTVHWQPTMLKEYVASLIGLYKNNGAVSCVGNYYLFITELAHRVHPGMSQDVSCNLIPHCMGHCHGQILIETATYSSIRSRISTYHSSKIVYWVFAQPFGYKATSSPP